MNRVEIGSRSSNVRRLAVAGLLTALAVAGSTLSFPAFGSSCAPVQHIVNIFCAVFLGPAWGVGSAFCSSLLRNLLSLGSPLAFPGSMLGALLCGLIYKKTKLLLPTLVGEVFGTGVLGGIAAYPFALLFMNKSASEVAVYTYIVPFLVSTAGGAIIAGVVLYTLKGAGALDKLRAMLNR